MPILATDNWQPVTDYRNVPDAELLEQRGIFVAEGRLVVRRLLADPALVTRSVMVTQTALESLRDLLSPETSIPVYVVPQELMNGITGFNMHRGCLAIGERPAARTWDQAVADARTVVVLEHVGNADNVGGVFRNAAAFAAGAVLLDLASADPLYRKTIRTSMGASMRVPFARVESAPALVAGLRHTGIVTIALTPSPDAIPLQRCAAALAGRRVALVLGHEGDGLSADALNACDHRARIPIAPGTDSLNVASASAIALYQLVIRDS